MNPECDACLVGVILVQGERRVDKSIYSHS